MLNIFMTLLLASVTSIYAIDRDTIVINKEHIRILNIDAPEIFHYKCDAEKRLGEVAKRRMQQMITSGPATLERGDHGRMKDRYGRSLARVIVNGADTGEELVKEDLAREWDGLRHSWCVADHK